MLLITTSDPTFWKHQGESLALGAWCLSNGPVLPHPWTDSDVRHAKYGEIDEIYEKLLPRVYLDLGRIHGIHADERYWRIIIGPWLKYALEIFFERFECLTAARQFAPNLSTRIAQFPSPVARNFDDFVVRSVEDDLNLWIYSEMIRRLDLFPYEERPFSVKASSMAKGSQPLWKNVLRKALVFLGSLGGGGKLYIKDCSLRRFEQWSLSLHLGSWPRWAQVTPPKKVVGNETLAQHRSTGKLSGEEMSFENLALSLVWQIMPRCYLEDFAPMRKSSLMRYPKTARTILSGNSYHADELFKIWCAEQVHANGARLIAEQHGGLYGTGRYSSMENHEATIADRYLTWGWKRDDVDCQPTSNGKLLAARRELKPNREGKLLLVERGAPRYSYWSYSSPLPHQYLEALNEQFVFVENLDSSIRDELLVRLHALDWGWKVRGRWEEKFPEIRLSDGTATMNDELRISRLFVGTYNATTFLETLAANYPTIVFWNPMHWDLHPRARPMFEELKKAKIFFESPCGAAKHVNRVFQNPDSWWQSPETQLARENFCRTFAWAAEDPVAEWRKNVTLPALVAIGD